MVKLDLKTMGIPYEDGMTDTEANERLAGIGFTFSNLVKNGYRDVLHTRTIVRQIIRCLQILNKDSYVILDITDKRVVFRTMSEFRLNGKSKKQNLENIKKYTATHSVLDHLDVIMTMDIKKFAKEKFATTEKVLIW